MAWEDRGTITVTNGSTTVTGSETHWITGAQVGEAMLISGELYEIESISSVTSIVLADDYLGSTQSGLSYKIIPTQSLVADLASDVTSLISRYSTIADNAGAGKFNDGSVASPGIQFLQDADNGFYRIGSDNWGAVVGGSLTIEFDSTGIKLRDNKKIRLGFSDDFKLHHDGTHSYVENETGDLYLRNKTDDGDVLFQADNGSGGITSYIKFDGGTGQVLLNHYGTTQLKTVSSGVEVLGVIRPDDDNTRDLAISSKRLKDIYSAGSIISTSDAREKTETWTFLDAELRVAKYLSQNIVFFKWLSSVEQKGEDNARIHCGQTVQSVIAAFEAEGLDPFDYAMVCYDQWDDEFIEHPATETMDAWTEQVQKAGDRYSLRTDQLNQFMIRGLAQAQEDLESRILAIES